MTDLEAAGYFETYKGLILLGVTSGIGQYELPTNNALTYANTHFDGVDGVTGQHLNPDAPFLPWGGVVDLETMVMISMQDYGGTTPWTFVEVGAAMKDAYEN